MSERSVSRSNECDATSNEPSGVPNRPVGCSLSKAGSSFLIPCLVMLEGIRSGGGEGHGSRKQKGNEGTHRFGEIRFGERATRRGFE